MLLLILASMTLAGWFTGWLVLTRLGFDSIPMAPNTALALLVLGAALVGLAGLPGPPWAVWLARLGAGLVMLAALLRLGEYIPGINPGTDRWFLRPSLGESQGAPIGQMAYHTAVAFLLGGLALLLITFRQRTRIAANLAGYLAVGVLAFGGVFLLGYLYGAPFVRSSSVIPMALNTALGFLLLGAGLSAAAGPHSPPLAQLFGPSVQARLLRAFLPAFVLAVIVVAWLMYLVSQSQGTPSGAALVSAALVVAAIFIVSLLCLRIAGSLGGELERAQRDLQEMNQLSKAYAAELQAVNTTLELRIAERMTALRESRDYLEQFFTISTALQDPGGIEKTFDLVLGFCRRLGYGRAMLALVDREAGVIRAVKAVGSFTEVVSATVRPLDGNDILAEVAREGQTTIVADSLQDTRCDQQAIAAAGIRGQIIIPLVTGGAVVGTLQVASHEPLTPTSEEVRTLETLGSQAARALAGLLHVKESQRLNQQLEERNELLQQLADDLAAAAQSERMARDALVESEERIRLIVDTAHDAFVAIGMDGRIIEWNRQAETLFGWTRAEALGQLVEETIIPPRYRAGHRQGLAHFRATGEGSILNQRLELSAQHRDGHEFPIELTITAIPWKQEHMFSAFLHDITARKQAQEALQHSNQQLQLLADDLRETAASERRAHQELKRAQSQLVQSEKLAALGQLVAGVAHEINNPLSFVSNNVAVLQRDVRALRELLTLHGEAVSLLEEQRPELAGRIRELGERVDLPYTLENLDGLMVRSRDGLKRIQQIVKDLRDFARLDESDLHEVDLNAGIESTINIIQGSAKKQQVTLHLDLQPLPPVACYPAKVNQVILNLVANAIDACPPGATVTVSTRPEGDGVEIAVADTGSGIDPAIAERIFDPFFTTKPQGKGTGLGLSISYGIVQGHGGTIDFTSTPGQGTRFRVWLPRKQPGANDKKVLSAKC
jgi:PAS domain S-box-containing protein